MIILTRRQVNAAVVIMVASILTALVCSAIVIEGTYDRGRQAGYEAGHADGHRDAEQKACTVEGPVPVRCWSVDPALPQCEHEDGTPEGCLRLDIDGTVYWEVSE